MWKESKSSFSSSSGETTCDVVAELGAEQLEGVLVQRLRGRGHLAEVEEHRHECARVGVDLVGEVAQRRAAAHADDGRAVAAGNADATDRRRLHLLELLALRALGLAATDRDDRHRGRTHLAVRATTCAATETAAAGTTGEAAATAAGTTSHRDHRDHRGRRRDGAPPRAGRSPGRPTALRSGIMPGLGRAPPGRGPAGTSATGARARRRRRDGSADAACPGWARTGCCRDARRRRPRGRHPHGPCACPGWARTGCCPGAGRRGGGATGTRAAAPGRGSRAGTRGRRDAGALPAIVTGGLHARRPGPTGAVGSLGSGARAPGRASRSGAAGAAEAAGAAGSARGRRGGRCRRGCRGRRCRGLRGRGPREQPGPAAAGLPWRPPASRQAASPRPCRRRCLGAPRGTSPLTLRTTGGSMVELAVLTYSPCSFRWSSRVLLSVPSSLASALTRTLATFLLSWSVPDRRGPSLQLGDAHC